MAADRLPVHIDVDPTVRILGGLWVYRDTVNGYSFIWVVIEPLPRSPRRNMLLRRAVRRVAELREAAR